MKRWWQQWLLIVPGVFLADWAVEGIHAEPWWILLLVAVVLGGLNTFLKPLLIFFALPFVIFTLGFGVILINALLLFFAGKVVPGFVVEGFWPAFWGGLLISLVSMVVSSFLGDSKAKFRMQVNRGGSSGKGNKGVHRVQGRVRRGSGRDDVIDI